MQQNLHLDIFKNDLPDILRPLYGMGDMWVSFDNNSAKTKVGYHNQTKIQKSSGSTVETVFFCDPNNINISGVLYSKNWFGRFCSSNHPEYCFVKNVNAEEPINILFEKFAQEYDYSENRISML